MPGLLDVCSLEKLYSRGKHVVRAVDGVSFHVEAGETFGLVGESGCGKSTVARCILRLTPPTSGQIRFEDRDLLALKGRELKTLRRNLQIVFQDPYSSLDPRMTIRATLLEPLEIHRVGSRADREKRIRDLAGLVGLPESALRKYPHEFSGGQRQRIGIARALALNPKLVVADEPVSALDVSIQAQVINLMRELQRRLGLTYLFISHDLRVVRYVSDQVAVMYLGRIVELAPTETLYQNPLHPYTRSLLSAVPTQRWEETGVQPIQLEGEVPSPINPPPGCHFAPRCPYAQPRCSQARPPLEEVEPGHQVACFLVDDFR